MQVTGAVRETPGGWSLDGDWAVGTRRGRVHFDLDRAGRLVGTYTQEGSPAFQGVWNGGCVG